MTSVTSSDFVQMRKAMVESQLRPDSVSDSQVFLAFYEVPRHEFVPEESLALAYADAKVPIGFGRVMNPPIATARLINEANICRDSHVLLIGAGRGYSAAVLARLAGSVVALEENADLAKISAAALSDLDNVTVVEGALDSGSEDNGPFDVILVDGSIEEVPVALASQLKPGGRVVAAIVRDEVSRLSVGFPADGHIAFREFADSTTVALPGFARVKEFTF